MSPFALALTLAIAASSESSADLTIPGEVPVVVRLHIQVGGQAFGTAWEGYHRKLFADLDRNGDGKLDAQEAARVPAAPFLRLLLQGDTETEIAQTLAQFAALDGNRDGHVTLEEVAAYYRGEGVGPLVPLVRGGSGDAATDTLYRFLDADGDRLLSQAELQNAAEALHKLDLNEDEWWTAEEIAPARLAGAKVAAPVRPLLRVGAAAARTVDRELTVRLGGSEAKPGFVNPITFDRAVLVVEAADRPENPFASVRQFYLQELQAADADGRGFVEKKQLVDADFLRGLFDLADRDGNGKLTGPELTRFLNLHAEGSAALVTISIIDQSRGLFDLLDANGDGRLSLREIRCAWGRLRPFDRDGDGRLARVELPHQYQVRLTQGFARPRRQDAKRAESAATVRRGPAWFQALDRNGDGDVSPREFLGPEAAFRRLDLDSDGLISAAEAEKAPARPH